MLNLISILHLCVLIGIALRIFSRRNASGTAVGWLLLVVLLPGVGALMYLLIGERRLGKKWMQRALALRPEMLRWAADIPPECIAAPTTLTAASVTSPAKISATPNAVTIGQAVSAGAIAR